MFSGVYTVLELQRRIQVGSNWARVYKRLARTGFDGIRLPQVFRVRYRGIDAEGKTEREALSNALNIVGVRTRAKKLEYSYQPLK